MVFYEKTRPLLKRVPIIVDTYEGIQRFDVDNLYPQRVQEIARRSYTTQSVIKRVADFLNGDGFIDTSLNSIRVNEHSLFGTSLIKLLNQVSMSYATWNSVALHIGYDLNYRISSITHIPFEYCRMGLPDNDGRVWEIKYSTNWERDGRKDTHDRRITCYPIFDPSPDVVAMQIDEAGGIDNYKGQILYYTPQYFQYPLCSFDAVIDHAQAQAELGMGKVANTQNSFLSSLAIVFPGEFESDSERQQFQDLIANKSGARNMGSRIGLQDRSGTKKASDIFQSLTPPNLDRLFEFTEKSIVDAIMENEAMPKEILGVRPDTGMFNQQNMEQAYVYYNSITNNRRTIISEIFSVLLSNWQTPITTSAEIIPQKYVVSVDTTSAQQQAVTTNDTLKNLTGRQLQNIQRIVRKYNQSQLTFEQARQILMNGYGLTESDINDWLIVSDTTDNIPNG